MTRRTGVCGSGSGSGGGADETFTFPVSTVDFLNQQRMAVAANTPLSRGLVLTPHAMSVSPHPNATATATTPTDPKPIPVLYQNQSQFVFVSPTPVPPLSVSIRTASSLPLPPTPELPGPVTKLDPPHTAATATATAAPLLSPPALPLPATTSLPFSFVFAPTHPTGSAFVNPSPASFDATGGVAFSFNPLDTPVRGTGNFSNNSGGTTSAAVFEGFATPSPPSTPAYHPSLPLPPIPVHAPNVSLRSRPVIATFRPFDRMSDIKFSPPTNPNPDTHDSAAAKSAALKHGGRRPNPGRASPFQCATCGKSFTQRVCTTGGLHSAFGVPKHHSDGVCDSVLQGGLVNHERIHSGARPFKCKSCDRAFTQKCNLTRHERTHTGEKPYVCNSCDRRFRRKVCTVRVCSVHFDFGAICFRSVCVRQWGLKVHEKTVHKIGSPLARNSGTNEEDDGSDTDASANSGDSGRAAPTVSTRITATAPGTNPPHSLFPRTDQFQAVLISPISRASGDASTPLTVPQFRIHPTGVCTTAVRRCIAFQFPSRVRCSDHVSTAVATATGSRRNGCVVPNGVVCSWQQRCKCGCSSSCCNGTAPRRTASDHVISSTPVFDPLRCSFFQFFQSW